MRYSSRKKDAEKLDNHVITTIGCCGATLPFNTIYIDLYTRLAEPEPAKLERLVEKWGCQQIKYLGKQTAGEEI